MLEPASGADMGLHLGILFVVIMHTVSNHEAIPEADEQSVYVPRMLCVQAEGSGSAASRPRPYSPTPATHHDHHHHAHAGRPSDHADDSARHAPHCGGDEDGIDGDAYQTLLKMDEFKGDEVLLQFLL